MRRRLSRRHPRWESASDEGRIELVLDGKVERQVAANAATKRHDFLVALEQAEKRARAKELQVEKRSAVVDQGPSPPPMPVLRAAPGA
jgi:hypothetical protein